MSFALVSRWRDVHAAEREALIRAYLARPRPHALLFGLSAAADRLLRAVWQAHDLPAAAALVAVGGYGRGEMYPHSDVDLLLLLDDDLPVAEQARFEPLIGLFWDVGLPVGHSMRTLDECLRESAADITIQTNLLESRLLAGDADLYRRFRERQQAAMDPVAFFEAKLLEQRSRHGRAADRALRLEPDIKEHPGGLRDLHTIGWVCRAAGLPTGLRGLARAGLLTPAEARRIAGHQRFLADLRIRLHLAAGRREDRLVFERQERLAADMGIAARGNRRASERLMQHYFRTARELSLANEFLLSAVRCHLKPVAAGQPLAGFPGLSRRGDLLDLVDGHGDYPPRNDETHARHDRHPHPDPLPGGEGDNVSLREVNVNESWPERHPEAILDCFLALQRHPDLVGFTPGALRALWRAGKRIDSPFRRNPRHRAQFLALLREPRRITRCFRLMHRLGILGRYLPGFSRVTGQMQHDLYHVYPVDEHILTVLRNLRRMAIPDLAHELPLAHRLMTDFDRPDLLYLAALFHDIAKGRGGDHSLLGEAETRRFCRAHGLPGEDTALVCWLVREHLTLSSTAQRQDLSDPEVIHRFAALCGDRRRLTALYLLTLADIRGTNPAIWNAWKDNLLRELYLAARRALEGGRPALDSIEEKKEEARASLRLYGYPTGAEENFWQRMDDVWFLRLPAQEIAWQTRRLLPLLGREPVVVRARLAPIGEGIEVLVYAPDQEALFARICGFFAALHYTVLEAKVHSTRDGYALDSFLAMDEGNRVTAYRDILSYIEYELAANIRDRPPLAEVGGARLPRQLKSFPLEPKVVLSRVETGHGNLLSVAAGDRPGLLYDIARVLTRHRVNVLSAKINTLGQRAEDVFVLEGGPLERPEERRAIERELLAVLKIG